MTSRLPIAAALAAGCIALLGACSTSSTEDGGQDGAVDAPSTDAPVSDARFDAGTQDAGYTDASAAEPPPHLPEDFGIVFDGSGPDMIVVRDFGLPLPDFGTGFDIGFPGAPPATPPPTPR